MYDDEWCRMMGEVVEVEWWMNIWRVMMKFLSKEFGCLTSMCWIFGRHWNPAAKKSHSKQVSQQRSLTAKKSHSTEIPQERNILTAKKSHSKEISQQRGLTAQRSHSKEISQQRNLTAKRSHSKEISQLLKNKYLFRNLAAAAPLRSAETEWQNTKAQHQQQETKSHLNTSVTARARSPSRIRLKARMAATVAQTSQLFSAAECPFTKKTCFVQMLGFKSHLGCSISKVICQQWVAKHSRITRHCSKTTSLLYLYLYFRL